MKKPILIAALVIIAGTANAQDRAQRSPEEMAKARTERLTTVLELTPEQAAKVQALHLKHAQEAEAHRARQKADREIRQAEMAGKRSQHEAEMKSILTAEQYQKWEAMRGQQRDHKNARREKGARGHKH